MNIEDGIKMLSGLKQNKEKEQDHKEVKHHAEGMGGLKDVLTKTMCELTKIIIGNRYSVSVSNFPKQDKMIKLLTEMNTHLIKIETKLYKVPPVTRK